MGPQTNEYRFRLSRELHLPPPGIKGLHPRDPRCKGWHRKGVVCVLFFSRTGGGSAPQTPPREPTCSLKGLGKKKKCGKMGKAQPTRQRAQRDATEERNTNQTGQDHRACFPSKCWRMRVRSLKMLEDVRIIPQNAGECALVPSKCYRMHGFSLKMLVGARIVPQNAGGCTDFPSECACIP